MPVLSRGLIVLCGTLVLAGSAYARDTEDGPLPCNSLCRRWMGMPPEASPEEPKALPPPQTILPNDVRAAVPSAPATVEVASQPALVKRAAPAIPAHLVVQRRLAERPVPLPPRPVREPATPFGALERIAHVDQVIASLPVPPPVPQVEVPVAPLPDAIPAPLPAITTVIDQPAVKVDTQPEDTAPPPPPQTEQTPAIKAPEQANAVRIEEKVEVARIEDEPPVKSKASPSESALGWPPPIDVIGALLMTASPAPRAEASAF